MYGADRAFPTGHLPLQQARDAEAIRQELAKKASPSQTTTKVTGLVSRIIAFLVRLLSSNSKTPNKPLTQNRVSQTLRTTIVDFRRAFPGQNL